MSTDKRTEATQVKAQKDAAAVENAAAQGQQSQAQSGSAETEQKIENDPAKRLAETGEPQFFDTTIAKVVTDEDGEERVVMSDHLAEGDRLKREVDAEKAEKRRKEADKDKK